MAWFSILPDNFSVVETWAARVFIFLGMLTIGPWAVLLVYDVLLYIWRSITHEVPLIGGRARGKARPRAPSLKERPDGHRRTFSLAPATSRNIRSPARTTGSTRPDGPDLTRRCINEDHEDSSSSTWVENTRFAWNVIAARRIYGICSAKDLQIFTGNPSYIGLTTLETSRKNPEYTVLWAESWRLSKHVTRILLLQRHICLHFTVSQGLFCPSPSFTCELSTTRFCLIPDRVIYWWITLPHKLNNGSKYLDAL